LGSGGIRDVEFTVQALQLLNGGADAGLRHRGSVAAMRGLVAAGHLNAREGKDLESAYQFLRTVEDRLQLLHGLQKHSLPESAEERAILARQLSFKSAGAFALELKKHQSRIRKEYLSVFGERQSVKRGASKASFESSLEPRKLRSFGFEETSIAGRRISEIIALLPELRQPNRLLALLGMIRSQGAPDWCIENLLLVSASIPINRSLQQVLSNERALELLTLLCSRTSRFIGDLAREPLLFESMVGRPEDLLSSGVGWEFLKESDLVRFRAFNDFKAVVRFIVGETGIRGFTGELSQLAEGVLRQTFHETLDEVRAARDVPLVLLALGKLGGGEISIGSDLDVVLLYKEKASAVHARTAVTVGRRLREKMEGVYEIDFRLRPEGKSSPLATEYEYYKQYLTNRASFWERQSLIKARIIAGDEVFASDVSRHLKEFVFKVPLPKNWNKDIRTMRQRMATEHSRRDKNVNLKTGSGGLADLEFIVQSLQLRYGGEHPRLDQANTFEAVSGIGQARLLTKRDFGKVEGNLEFFRQLEASIRMNSETTDFIIPPSGSRLRAVAAAMGASSPAALLRTISRMRRENHSLFINVLRSRLA
jgi:glutamate-ammonia-ligase adenylyltransferase